MAPLFDWFLPIKEGGREPFPWNSLEIATVEMHLPKYKNLKQCRKNKKPTFSTFKKKIENNVREMLYFSTAIMH